MAAIAETIEQRLLDKTLPHAAIEGSIDRVRNRKALLEI